MMLPTLTLTTAVFALFSSASAAGPADASPFRRRLEDVVDYSWMANVTMKFEQCFVDSDGASHAYFSFCPATSKCVSGCKGGTEYVADMATFVDAFTESQLGYREYACEMVRESCAEEDVDTCYANAGLNCEEREKGAMNIQEYLVCKKFDKNGYYVGPYCFEGKIHLGYFSDEACTQISEEGTFEASYGYSLEYSAGTGVSLVDNTCADCIEHKKEGQNNNNNQNNNNGEAVVEEVVVSEECSALHGESQKWADVSAQYSGLIKDIRKSSNTSKIVLGVVVAILASMLLLGCMWHFMGATNEKKKALLAVE